MKDLLSKEYYCYKIHKYILLIKSSADSPSFRKKSSSPPQTPTLYDFLKISKQRKAKKGEGEGSQYEDSNSQTIIKLYSLLVFYLLLSGLDFNYNKCFSRNFAILKKCFEGL